MTRGRVAIVTVLAAVLVVAFVAVIGWGSAAPREVSAGWSSVLAAVGGLVIGYELGQRRGRP